MKKRIRTILAGILCLCMVLALCGCGGQLRSYRPIDNVEDLDGRKIGVTMGYAADYILSPRDGRDMFLYRYDTNADMLMALCYRQVDAIVVDALTWQVINSSNKGLHRVEEPAAMDGSILYSQRNKADLRDAFNEFIAEYRQTEAYADLAERIQNFDGSNYAYHSQEMTGTGRKVIMGYDMECYPFCFVTAGGEMQGFEVELMIAFANANNYQLELVPSAELDMYMGIENNKYDMIFGQISIAYAGEAELIGIPTTDPYFERPLYFVEVDDLSQVEIGEMLEEMD